MFTVYAKDSEGNVLATVRLNGQHITNIVAPRDDPETIIVKFRNGETYPLPASGIDIVHADMPKARRDSCESELSDATGLLENN